MQPKKKYRPYPIVVSIWGLLICTLLSSNQLPAQPALSANTPSDRPAISAEQLTGQQVMRIFDFEERDIHFDPIPMHWRKFTDKLDDGFPHYSIGRLDDTRHRSGQYSFQLISDGGSIGFNYHRRRLRARPGIDFQVTTYVYLEHADHSRAQLTCTLTDRTGKIIPNSHFVSRQVGPDDQGPQGWTRLEVYVPGNFPEARYLTLGLWLLQEAQWNLQAVSASRVLHYDVKAMAWFDDISVIQLPRVILRTAGIGNVFDVHDPVELIVEVEGVGSSNYQVRLNVLDAGKNLISEEAWILSGVEGAGKTRSVSLADLPAGLYHVSLSIMAGQQTIATRELDFATLAPLSKSAAISGSDFGITALNNQVGPWPIVSHLIRLSNAKLIKLPVWPEKPTDPISLSQGDFENYLINLQKNNINVIAAFDHVPPSLATQLSYGHHSIFDAFSQAPDRWQPQVSMILAQYARQISHWQVGSIIDQADELWDPRMQPIVTSLNQLFKEFIIDPVLAAPVNSFIDIHSEQVATEAIALDISAAIMPDRIPEYIREFRDKGFGPIWASIHPLDPDFYNREHRLIDFTKRITQAKLGGIDAVFIRHPWNKRHDNAREIIEPTELFLIYRTLSDLLGQKKFLGRFSMTPDIEALIFEQAGDGIIFAWHNNYQPNMDPDQTDVSLLLGERPQMVDVFGNRFDLPAHNGKTMVHVTNWPIIITGINPRLAQLRTSLSITPDTIDSNITSQRVQCRFTNPFNSTISGKLRFVRNDQQQNWVIDPATMNFTLGAKQAFDQTLTLKFPRNEVGGQKVLSVQMFIDSDRTYRLNIDLPFEIELQDIDLSYFARRVNESDLLIQKVITNNSKAAVNLISFVDLPDRNRLERSVSQLQPDNFVTKNYLIPNAAQWQGQFIRLGLYDPKGTRRINYRLPIN